MRTTEKPEDAQACERCGALYVYHHIESREDKHGRIVSRVMLCPPTKLARQRQRKRSKK